MDKVKTNFYHLLMLLSIPLINVFYTILNNNTRGVYNLTMEIDRNTPFLKEFIIPYTLWYPFIFLTLLYLCVKNKEYYYKTLASINIGLIICYIIYFFFQTTVPRPEIVGTDFFTKLLSLTYKMDKPFNCFPSIHVLTCYLMIKGISFSSNKPIKLFISSCSIVIIISTLFVKQHVFMDLIGGILLGELIFSIINKINWKFIIPIKIKKIG